MDDGALDSSTRANSGCMTLQCLQTCCAHFTGRLRSGTWPLLAVHSHSKICIPTRVRTCVSEPSVTCKVSCHAYLAVWLAAAPGPGYMLSEVPGP